MRELPLSVGSQRRLSARSSHLLSTALSLGSQLSALGSLSSLSLTELDAEESAMFRIAVGQMTACGTHAKKC